jgi:hypothetical protein
VVGLTDIDHNVLGRLALDTDESLIGVQAAALFSPCVAGPATPFDCRAGADVTGSPCRRYRYALTRTWDSARPSAVFVMLNPSTADAWTPDPTIRRCIGYAKHWQAGGLTVLNAFALRSPNPVALKGGQPVGPDNDRVIAAVLAAGGPGPVIVAWGSDETLVRTGRDLAVLDLLHAAGVTPRCLGLTKEGYPRHPLYLRRDADPVPYQCPGGSR